MIALQPKEQTGKPRRSETARLSWLLNTDRGEVKQRAEAKIADIEEKISDLERMKHALTVLAAACSGCGPTSECPILEGMKGEEVLHDSVD